MAQPARLQLNLRSVVIMLMTLIVVAFSSAETRAAVMVKMAEEQGVSRFYEDKVVHYETEVVRVAQMQTLRKPEVNPRPVRKLVPHVAALPTERPFFAAGPRAPPHCPRAPPAVA